MRKIIDISVRGVIGIIIISLLIYKLDFNEIVNTIWNFSSIIIILVVTQLIISITINTINFKLLFSTSNQKINFKDLIYPYLVSWSTGRFLPGGLGEFFLIPLLKKKIPKQKTGAIVFIDRIITLLALIFFSIFGFFIFLEIKATLKILIIVGVLITIIIIFIISKNIREKIISIFLRKYSSKLKDFSENISFLIKNKKGILVINVALTTLRIIISAAIFYIIFTLLEQKTSIFEVTIINSITQLSTLIPISIAGLGITETVSTFLYSSAGFSALIVGSVYILFRIIYYVVAGIILMTRIFTRTKKENKDSTKEIEEEWNKKYDSLPKKHITNKINFLPENWLPKKDDLILEAGCGNGELMGFYKSIGRKRIIGIDISETALKEARKVGKVIKADIRKMPFKDETFDYISSYGVIEHFREQKPLIKEMIRVLKKNGKIYIMTHHHLSLISPLRQLIRILGLYTQVYAKDFKVKDIKKKLEEENLVIEEIKIQRRIADDLPKIKKIFMYTANQMDKLISIVIKNWGNYIHIIAIKK